MNASSSKSASAILIGGFLLSIGLGIFACGDSSTANDSTDTSSSTTPAPPPVPEPSLLPPYPIEDSSNVQNIGGVQVYTIVQGTGPVPKPGSNVLINYRGTLLDGTEFDSSFDKDGYVDFSLNQLIAGWKIALSEVRVGSKVKLIVPSNLAYGEAGRPNIPPNSTLIFDIDLVSTY